jgi:hypothetical protein
LGIAVAFIAGKVGRSRIHDDQDKIADLFRFGFDLRHPGGDVDHAGQEPHLEVFGLEPIDIGQNQEPRPDVVGVLASQ